VTSFIKISAIHPRHEGEQMDTHQMHARITRQLETLLHVPVIGGRGRSIRPNYFVVMSCCPTLSKWILSVHCNWDVHCSYRHECIISQFNSAVSL